MLPTILGVLTITGAVVGVIGWWFSRQASRTKELTAAAGKLRGIAHEVTSGHGLGKGRFLTDDAKAASQALEDTIRYLVDGELKTAAAWLLDRYNKTWAAAPPFDPMVRWSGDPPPPMDPVWERHLDLQVEHAREVLVAVDRVLDRAAKLEKRLLKRSP